MSWASMILQTRMDAVYLVYGLSFVVAGVAIFAQPRMRGQFLLADIIWLYVAYALVHAPADFIHAWMADAGRNVTAWRVAEALTLASHLFLFEFARRLIAFSGHLRISWWALPAIAAGIAAVSLASTEGWNTADALVGYLIRTPAGIIASAGFILYPKVDERFTQIPRANKYFYIAAATLLVWTLFCGMTRARADFFPATWLNADSFRRVIGAPVEVFRTVCGIVTVWTIAMILRIIHAESVNAARRAEAEAHFRGRIQDALDIQTATNAVLHVGLEEGNLDAILGRALNEIISVPWLSIERKGAVFLADLESRILEMRAQQGLSSEICATCTRLPYGKCLCGRAVETSTLQFADHLDERHDIHYHGMTGHGHYVIPMRFRDTTIGVLNLYLVEGHARDTKEEEFLTAIAAVLSGVVIRKQAEDALKDRERALRQALAEARAAETLKARILANLSHEIRTPLNHVIGLTSILQKEPDLPPAERLAYLEMIKRGGLSTLRLATAVLDLSTIQSDNSPPTFRPFPFREWLAEIGERFTARATAKGLRFCSRIDPQLPQRLAGNPDLLEKVLDNLLDNAFKFTTEGSVELRADVAAERGEEIDVSFVVTDTGVGIASEHLDKVFDAFFQAPVASRREFFGAGLGLTIVKEVTQRLGGSIHAASEVGEGSSFRFLCPFQRVAA